jgi:hypothetical protein
MTADEALVAGGKSSLALSEAVDFLQTLLERGPVSSMQVDAEAREAGVAKATLRRAKDNLGIKPFKDGMKGGWVWALPEALNSTEDAHVKSMSTFETNEQLQAKPPHAGKPNNGDMSEDGIEGKPR